MLRAVDITSVSRTSQPTVLYVDSDRQFARQVSASLRDRLDAVEVVTETETTPETVLSTVRSTRVDCVVSSDRLSGTDEVSLLERVRESHPAVAVVLVAREGDQTVASRAVSAGVTDYVPLGTIASGEHRQDPLVALAERIEATLAEHERRSVFETMVEALPGMAYRARNRPERPVEFAAGDVEGLTGYTTAAFESGTVSLGTDLVSPAATGVWERMQTQLAAENEFEVSYPVVTESGTERWVCDRGRVVGQATGRSALVEGFLTDITDRVEREQELRQYRQFIEHMPDTVAVLDDSLAVTYQSPNAPGLEHEPVQVSDDDLFEYVHPDDTERVGDTLDRLLADPDGVVTLECRARSAGGAWRWIEARAQNYLGTDPVDGILVSVRDITERKQREQKLSRYSETLETLQEVTQDLLDASDAEAVAALTMTSIETILEFEVAGMWLADADRERLEPVALTGQREGLVAEMPTYTAADGGLSWAAYSTNSARTIDDMREHERRYNPETEIRSELIVPLDEYGLLNIGTTEPGGFTDTDRTLVELWAGTVTTVLSRLEHERELREQEAEVARERDRLDAFAGVVSHDLRNPLHVASSRLELFADERGEDEHVRAARQALDRMERLVEDLLVLAREGEAAHDTEVVALEPAVETAWSTARTGDAALVVETDAAIQADRGRLVQLFENLFRNAVEHGGPAVTVTVGDHAGGFYIADDGPGIPADERDQVFESGYSTAGGSSGLGLSIVRRIVTAHGWEIRVVEGERGGARFEVTGVDAV